MYHLSVMQEQAIEALIIRPDGIYVDCTFGGGGHSRAILERLNQGRLFAFDQDPSAGLNVPEDDRFLLIRQNFRYLGQYLKYFGYPQVDGILADLGVSSHQFDHNDRGFSFREDGPLDMRMNPENPLTAAQLLNTYTGDQLFQLFREYGNLPQAGRISRSILESREEKPFEQVADLLHCLESFSPPHQRNKFFAQVFQSLRMEVNQEIPILRAFLEQVPGVLRPDGRLVIISFHSGEDRLVKDYMRSGWVQPDPLNMYGGPDPIMRMVTRKSLTPDQQELDSNNRSRSARMRVAEKI
jgi:16S rRNA (cytosine1402-N4)-methyltransferase